MKKKELTMNENIIEFLMIYGWAILAAVIAIGILAYFGVFSPNPSGYDYKCLADKLCKNQSLELEKYQDDPQIWCKENIIKDVYWIIEFKLDSWESLKQMFPECEVKN